MSYLIDTDWIADSLAGQRAATDVIVELRRSGIAISTISYMEVLDGIIGGTGASDARRGFRRFLRGTRVIVVSRPIADRAARIRVDLRQQKRQVNERALDFLIAATAIEHGLTLVTRNVRDYADIAGLSLHDAVRSPS